MTYRICKLLESQKQLLLDFLLHDDESTPAPPSPLPILPTLDNGERVDPEDPIKETGVYRDIWERRERPSSEGDSRLRDVYAKTDYPNADDFSASARRAWLKKDREQHGAQQTGVIL